jgi:hypothetical protein
VHTKDGLYTYYVHRPAPCLGADTIYVFKNLPVLSDEHIELMDDEGILM